jgi:hypothetical protein
LRFGGAALRSGTARSLEDPILETRVAESFTRLSVMPGRRASVGTTLATYPIVRVPPTLQYTVLTVPLARRMLRRDALGTARAGPGEDV